MKSKLMQFLFPIESDPVSWAEWIVGSWTKFLIWGTLYSYIAYSVVMRVASGESDRPVYAAMLLIIFYLTLLYGLRHLYMAVKRKEKLD
ncbi:MAG: hypothetical protein K9M49_02125 [Candidatus Marinimicrobia bacterium]|nr:hypothetical protein [Candidatus Neomarinimicrobiota bacterium]MCF7903928.1 hypothetical protein [Candidatus Neomarinimicrobiota bacterium]